ncbi:TatD family hydrolase [candidate division KSB1 bacterium]|nr:TatD family hydrolase [candidate division KSB1 bacterium]
MASIPIIDTHTHLADPVFDQDRQEVLDRARQAGVSHVFLVSETLEEAMQNLELSRANAMLKSLAGLYPTYLDMDEADRMIQFIRSHRDELIGIGEVGLDFWKVKEEQDRIVQRKIFEQFISLSLELDLPLNIHSRSAGRHVIQLLVDKGAKRVHLHAFDGKASTAKVAIEAGYYFSIPPSIVRSNQKKKLVKQMPLSCLMLETDSPVLSPEPDERNEPANILLALEAMADLKGVDFNIVGRAAYENTVKLYGPLA